MGIDKNSTVTSELVPAVSQGTSQEIVPGAAQLPEYVPFLKGRNCGLIVNQSSLVGSAHLVDTLRSLEVEISRIFVPEHGFRGKADAGAHIDDGVDEATGIGIVSLYGKNKKPTLAQLEGIEVMVYDLQDVGVRCYTYASTLHYVMEACAENGIPMIVLDRPSPNGHYVDGPVLKEAFSSFIGMHPVPFVHGMTIGEYATMIKGEGWIRQASDLDLKVVPCHGYDHLTSYTPPVAPSPNLRTERAILLYPSLVWFEGTVVSVGRGTDLPFEVYGHPGMVTQSYTFTPRPVSGAMRPKLEGQQCLGKSFTSLDPFIIRKWGQINLDWLIEAYETLNIGEAFFLENGFFDKLAGTDKLRKSILNGEKAEVIRQGWQEDLRNFEKVRSRYLMYTDES